MYATCVSMYFPKEVLKMYICICSSLLSFYKTLHHILLPHFIISTWLNISEFNAVSSFLLLFIIFIILFTISFLPCWLLNWPLELSEILKRDIIGKKWSLLVESMYFWSNIYFIENYMYFASGWTGMSV